MRNSLSIRLLVIFSLLFAQLGGLTHGIAHVLAEQLQSGNQFQSDDQSPQHEKHCDFCDAYAQIASAIGSSIISFTPCRNFFGIEQNQPYSFSSIASFPFAARAPPYPA